MQLKEDNNSKKKKKCAAVRGHPQSNGVVLKNKFYTIAIKF